VLENIKDFEPQPTYESMEKGPVVTKMEITKMSAYEMYLGHVELWKWLSLNPERQREDWPGWVNYTLKGYDYSPMNDDCCFGCEYSSAQMDLGLPSCCSGGRCIVLWGPDIGCCGGYPHHIKGKDTRTPYQKWNNAISNTERAEQARLCSELPFNSEIHGDPLEKSSLTKG